MLGDLLLEILFEGIDEFAGCSPTLLGKFGDEFGEVVDQPLFSEVLGLENVFWELLGVGVEAVATRIELGLKGC